MQINKFIIKNFFYSALIAIFSCLTVFFIFSLIGNLNNNHHFLKIITISLLNSLQIIFFIPSIVFLLNVYLFCYFLMAKNEIMILRQYVHKLKIISILFLFLITITLIEVNKSKFIDYIENIKLQLSNDKNDYRIKLIINSNKNEDEFIILKDIDIQNRNIIKFNYFKTKNNNIENSIYSENQTFSDNMIELSNFYEQEGVDIQRVSNLKIIKINNLLSFLKSKKFTNINKAENSIFKLNVFLKYVHYFILFSLILIMLISNSSLRMNQTLLMSTLWGITSIIYSYILFNINFISFNALFIILGIIVIAIALFKNLIYE